MDFPKIDLTSLPDLEVLTGLFGAMRNPGHNDGVVVIAAIVYEAGRPSGLM